MPWKTFELTKVTSEKPEEYEMPYSAPAPIVQDADEILHGDTVGKIEGGKVSGGIETVNLEKASHHIVKEVLEMESFPRQKNLKLEDLDGQSLNKLKQHYLEVDIQGKNLSQSGEEQNSSEKQ